jgi:putative copper resistance protein D
MLQHLLLIMVIPAFLVLGRPLTMLMALSPGVRGVATKRVWHYVFSAPTSLGVYTVVLVGSHLTGVMADVMQRPWAGQVEHAVYLVAGIQFFTAAVGNAPVAWRLSYPGRLFMVMAAMVVDAFVGIVLLQATTPIATLAHPGWGPTLLADTHLGGALMWVVGDGLMAVVPVCVYLAWSMRSEQRAENASWFERARVGRAVDRGAESVDDTGFDDDDAQLDAYNRWLGSLNRP